MSAGAGMLAGRLAAAMSGCLPDPAPPRLGVAVSGGGDSVALLVLLADWAAARGLALAAVTVDHGLRPESASEAAAVGRLAADLGLPHDVLRWERSPDEGGNLQDAARRARLRLIANWASARDVGAVALGHTQDDQAETVLLRLARGSGVDGLSAMAPVRLRAGLRWIRPLLGVTRADLRAELRRRGIGWVEDPSNEDPRFDRVRARQALRLLAPLGIDAARLADTARHMATARAALESATADAARRLARVGAGGEVTVEATGLAALPEEIRLRLVAHALCWVAAAEYRPRRAALERLLAEGGGTLHGCRALLRRGYWCILREPAAAEAAVPVPLGAVWDGRWRVSGPGGPEASVAALGAAGLAACPGWRASGLPREVLRASPAVWCGERLLAAPLAGLPQGYAAVFCPPGGGLADAVFAH